MGLGEPYPEIENSREAGQLVSDVGASEGASGNISLCIGWPLEVRRRFPVWSKHGVMARSDQSATHAADRIDYVETATMYERMDLRNGVRAEGLTHEDLRMVGIRRRDVPGLMR